ncbi:MAG TPA: MopE-related protein, partial [Myxococcota bacterium]|nr:MopE-related protein [Myxococcota bacterium]
LADRCDGRDDDCDGRVDEDAPSAPWFVDLDGDGHGDPTARALACAAPAGSVALGDDCDDRDARVHPGAVEVCDRVDQDCDGAVDEDLPRAAWFIDADGDGYGDDEVVACARPPTGVSRGGDCDDDDPGAWPGAREVWYDGVDQACDGGDDWDRDGDGRRPAGYGGDLDCDDRDASVGAPGAWFRDDDGDGYGDADARRLACDAPIGFVADDADCDDQDPDAWPGAAERCDARDDDCDGQIDEDAGAWLWPDGDGDGEGDAHAAPIRACRAPLGYAPDARDCDDGDPGVYVGAPERCDGRDNDCSAITEADPDPVCGVSTRQYQRSGSVYQAMPATGTWDAAARSCEGMGYHLMWPETAAEQEDVRRALGLWDVSVWLGVISGVDAWCWYDGRRRRCDVDGAAYGAPDPAGGGQVDWVVFADTRDVDWDVLQRASPIQLRYVCESEL